MLPIGAAVLLFQHHKKLGLTLNFRSCLMHSITNSLLFTHKDPMNPSCGEFEYVTSPI
jgi:hypothetical protein